MKVTYHGTRLAWSRGETTWTARAEDGSVLAVSRVVDGRGMIRYQASRVTDGTLERVGELQPTHLRAMVEAERIAGGQS